jgi:hypothetical protein
MGETVPFIPARPRHLALLYPQIVQGHSVLATHFTTIISFPYFFLFPSSFSLPSGDRLASTVFMFETGLTPNIESTRVLAYRFPVFLATAWVLFFLLL